MKYIILLFLTGCSIHVQTYQENASKHFKCMSMCEYNRQSPFADDFYVTLKATEQFCYNICNKEYKE